MSQKSRLFIASSIQELSGRQAGETLETVYAQRETIGARTGKRVKWVPPDQWHLTWLFLGAVEHEAIEPIKADLTEALSVVKPVPAELEEVVFWPKPRKANLIVCRLKHDPKLLRVWDALCKGLPAYPADKAFKPHITLARLKEEQTRPQNQKTPWGFSPLEPSSWLIDSVTLYQSLLTPAGPVYTPLHRVSLTP
ncbi:MAG: 2-5 ligase [Vampirovibrio sp.]|jgi:2'-5' RNA ligase|nr:2-5 ligase [Vampirovibrio sp.]